MASLREFNARAELFRHLATLEAQNTIWLPEGRGGRASVAVILVRAGMTRWNAGTSDRRLTVHPLPSD